MTARQRPRKTAKTGAWLLRDAADLVEGARASTHGDAVEQLALTARLWSGMLGVAVTPLHVAFMLQQMKMARALCGDATHADHYADMAGYAALAFDLAQHHRKA